MPGNDPTIRIDQDRNIETKCRNAAADLMNLTIAMDSSVFRIQRQTVG
jgi:hypothetical protein